MKRIALIGENSVEYIRILLKIWNQKDCAVLLDWRIPLQKAFKMMKEAEVTICYIEEKYIDKNADNYPEWLEIRTYHNSTCEGEYLPEDCYAIYHSDYSADEAVVIYSSGTTGSSKGIILSKQAININADAIINYMQPCSDDCIYLAKSLAHSSTLIGELLVALKTKTKVVVTPTVVPPRYVLHNIEKYQVSIICLNPTLLKLYVDELKKSSYNITTLKCIYVSGSILNDVVLQEARKVIANVSIFNVYGLTEAGPRVTAQSSEYHTFNSVGRPIQGVEVVIVDDLGKVVPTGISGSVHVNTPSRYLRYINGELKYPSLYKDWLNTGDIGRFDENEELYILGRSDDVIILDAHKIYPYEVEKEILKITGINECAVVALPKEDHVRIACVYTSYRELSIVQIISELRKTLISYEIPQIFKKVDKMPHVVNGKVDYKNICRILTSNC